MQKDQVTFTGPISIKGTPETAFLTPGVCYLPPAPWSVEFPVLVLQQHLDWLSQTTFVPALEQEIEGRRRLLRKAIAALHEYDNANPDHFRLLLDATTAKLPLNENTPQG